MIEWNIQARAHVCQQCGKPFADQEPYHTVLFEDQAAYVRRDLCGPCWGQEDERLRASTPQPISHWQGVYEQPAPPSELIRKETAETLLHKLIELGDPRYLAAMFILAVMLERKRLLKVKDQVRRDGRKTLIYEQPKTGEVLAITDPDLSMDQLEEVQRDVSRLLEHGLPEPGVGEASGSGLSREAAAPDLGADSPAGGEPEPRRCE
jgi:hypothetical protein